MPSKTLLLRSCVALVCLGLAASQHVTPMFRTPHASAGEESPTMERISFPSPSPSFGDARVENAFAMTQEDYDDLPLLPEAEKAVGWGFNSVSEAITLPMIQFHYTAKRTFYDPHLRKTYRVPDELFPRNTPEFHSKEAYGLYKSEEDFLHSEVTSSYSFGSVWLYYVTLGWSYSKTKGELKTMFNGQQREMYYGDKTTGLYELTMYPTTPLHPNVQRVVDALPTSRENDSDKRAYQTFIQHFGTHYVSKGLFGGKVNFTTLYDSELHKTHTDEWVDEQARISVDIMKFKIGVNAGGGHHDEKTHMDIDFEQHQMNITDSAGGSAVVKTFGNYTEWLSTVVENPTLLPRHTKYVPIFALIRDEAKRELMKQAVVDYANTKPDLMSFNVKGALASASVGVNPEDLPPVPGAEDYIGVGVDGSTLETKLPVIAKTYSSDPGCYDCVYTTPGYPDLKYKVPEQLIVMNAPESLLLNGTFVYQNVDEYEKRTVEEHKHHGFLGFGSHSKKIVDYYHMYFEHDYALSTTYQYYSWYTLTMPTLPPPPLDPMFEQSVKALPTEYKPEDYKFFLDNYGTHYSIKAHMGGMLNGTTFFHKCFLEQFTLHWVTEQSSWSIAGIIGGGHSHEGRDEHEDKKFWQYSEAKVDLYGGYEFQKDQVAEWVKTIKLNPRGLKYELRPISDLIADKTVAANVDKAVEAYLAEEEAAAQKLREELARNNPHKVPDWCKAPPPHPPLMAEAQEPEQPQMAIAN